ncbi:MAG TPA: response regulator transcription factor [Dehalococcoidia bacterium]|nr:response regulator transcription factor [Dehalococcoidia bacterium]
MTAGAPGPSTGLRAGPRILVVEDEAQLRYSLRRSLEEHGYSVREAEDGAGALREVAAFKPDVVLLDLMLPDMSGVEVCREIRLDHETPIVVLSALGDEKTKVQALDAGADDYLTKPFGMDELFARIRVALRHGSSLRAGQAVVEAGELRVDFEKRSVTLRGVEVHLTPTEYSLLKYLATHAGKVLTHPMILREVWGAEYADDTAVLRTYVNQLRAKLEDDQDKPRYIRTEPRVGYRFGGPEDFP